MNIRVRLKASFPSNIRAEGGIGISKNNGEWAIVPEWEDLTQIISVPDPNIYEIWTRNIATGTYNRMTAQALVANAPAGPTGATGATGSPGSDGIFSNSYLAKTSAYTAANADKGKTIVLSSGFFTFTLNAISGGNYDANYVIVIHNADTGRAKRIAPAGIPSFRLWPGQTVTIRNENSVWVRDQQWSPWRAPAGFTLYVDELNGSDTNDGMVAGTGNALQTLNAAIMDIVHNEWFMGNGSPQVTIQLTDNGTAGVPAAFGYAPLHFSGGLAGSEGRSTVVIQGNAADPSKTIIIGTASGSAIGMFGNARCRIKNVTLRGTGGASCLSVNDGAECRIQTGVRFQPAPGAAQIGINSAGRVILEGNITVDTGVSDYFLQMNGNGWFDTQSFGVTWSNSHTYSYVLYLTNGSILAAYNTTWAVSAGLISGTRFYCDNNSVIALNAVDPNIALTFGTVNGALNSGGRVGTGSELNFQQRARTSAYTAQQSDDGRKLCLGGAAFYAVTFSAVSSYSDSFCCIVVNEDAARAKDVVLTGTKTVRLYPGQHVMVWSSGQSGVWCNTDVGRWKKQGAIFYVNKASGSDANDGLVSGSPFSTMGKAINTLYNDLDCQNSAPQVMVADGIYPESLQISGQLTGYNFFYLVGASFNTVWRPAGPGTPYCCIIGDNAEMIIGPPTGGTGGITLDLNGYNGGVGLQVHQTGVVDTFQSIKLTGPGTSCTGFSLDHGGASLNISSNITVEGNWLKFYDAGPATFLGFAAVNHNFLTPGMIISAFLTTTGGFISCNPSQTFTGNVPTTSSQKWVANGNGTVATAGLTTIPGSVAGTPVLNTPSNTGGVAY